MKKQKTDNFIVWPLEVIDRSLYFDINGRADLRAFRRAATFRERFWIQRLQTSAPRGLHCRIPRGRQQNDRMYRPNRWLNRQTNKIVTESCINCVHFNTEGEIQIHSNSGMDSQLRLSAKKLLYMSARYSEQDIKIDIGNMSHKHRIGVLRWLNENISNKDLMEHSSANDSVTLIERLLREHLERRSEGFHAKNKQFGDFIKLVHSNEFFTFLDIRAVLRDPAICSIYDGSEIRICDKQQLPLGRTLCNYTSVAMQVQPNEPLPDAHSCPCRNNNLLYQTTDLVDGHVVSCNPDLIKNVQVRKLFTYGAKFRQNVSVS